MNWGVFLLLYIHEMRLLVRARRTIVLSVLLPALIMPLMIFASKYSNDQRAQTLADTTYKFAIVGPLSVRIRGLIEKTKELHSSSPRPFKFAEILTDNPQNALETGDIQFYIRTQTGEDADKLPG